MDEREQVSIVVFPHDDLALRAHAESILRFGVLEAKVLEERLRTVFPSAVVRAQAAMASFGRPRWYVYRDGSARPETTSPMWESNDTGTLTISRDGRYLSADQAAAAVFGVPAETIPGARIGSFTKHEGSDEGGQRAFERLAATGSLSSTAIVVTPDGREWPIDYRIDVEGEAFRMVVRRRAV